MADAAMLKVEGLTFRYEDMAMVFDLALARGQCLALLGPSGAGKSPLLSLVAGFAAPLGGRVMLDGRAVTGWTPAARPGSDRPNVGVGKRVSVRVDLGGS